jgi:hypothetical protein
MTKENFVKLFMKLWSEYLADKKPAVPSIMGFINYLTTHYPLV